MNAGVQSAAGVDSILQRAVATAARLQHFVRWLLEFDMDERMMKWFEYSHLPDHLQAVSKPFGDLARSMCETIESGPERTVALRKLLESKDAAVRAKLNPGG